MDKFDDALHRIGDWAAEHGKAATGIVCFALGLILGLLVR